MLFMCRIWLTVLLRILARAWAEVCWYIIRLFAILLSTSVVSAQKSDLTIAEARVELDRTTLVRRENPVNLLRRRAVIPW